MQAEGYPHPEQSGGRSAAEVCTSEARKIGEWLAGARGEAPLSSFCLFYPVGRCGEGGPPRRGGSGERVCRRSREETSVRSSYLGENRSTGG